MAYLAVEWFPVFPLTGVRLGWGPGRIHRWERVGGLLQEIGHGHSWWQRRVPDISSDSLPSALPAFASFNFPDYLQVRCSPGGTARTSESRWLAQGRTRTQTQILWLLYGGVPASPQLLSLGNPWPADPSTQPGYLWSTFESCVWNLPLTISLPFQPPILTDTKITSQVFLIPLF